MQSLIGTGTVEADETIGSGIQIPDMPRNNATIEAPTDKQRQTSKKKAEANFQVQVSDGLHDMKVEIMSLRNELIKLSRVVMPLTAITDLSLSNSRALAGDSAPD